MKYLNYTIIIRKKKKVKFNFIDVLVNSMYFLDKTEYFEVEM